MHWKRSALVLLALASPVRALAAQDDGPVRAEVDSATTVRILRQSWLANPVQGRLVFADSQVIRLERHGEEVALPVAGVRSVRVSLGERSTAGGAWKGARDGLLLGAVASVALFGVSTVVDAADDCHDCYINMKIIAAILSVPTMAATTVIGAVAGAVKPGERWREVPLPMRVRTPLPPPQPVPSETAGP